MCDYWPARAFCQPMASQFIFCSPKISDARTIQAVEWISLYQSMQASIPPYTYLQLPHIHPFCLIHGTGLLFNILKSVAWLVIEQLFNRSSHLHAWPQAFLLYDTQTLPWIWINFYFLICFPKTLPSRAFERFTELSNSILLVVMVSSLQQGDDKAEKYPKLFLDLGFLIWIATSLISRFMCFA